MEAWDGVGDKEGKNAKEQVLPPVDRLEKNRPGIFICIELRTQDGHPPHARKHHQADDKIAKNTMGHPSSQASNAVIYLTYGAFL